MPTEDYLARSQSESRVEPNVLYNDLFHYIRVLSVKSSRNRKVWTVKGAWSHEWKKKVSFQFPAVQRVPSATYEHYRIIVQFYVDSRPDISVRILNNLRKLRLVNCNTYNTVHCTIYIVVVCGEVLSIKVTETNITTS